ncbi:MAG: hemerythrin domain-containing protein [Nitrosomonas sp.]|nr:hemerythrin domain-containing protein [Nitrosomonas sp.]MDP1951588.1 hemerythrin domain-containing protein [Nitrosomonas sp.]
MRLIQRQLYSDHHHFQQLLNCLSKEIDCFDFDNQREANMAIILSALDYLKVYADQWHHPAEDIIFNHLLEKKIIETKIIKQLLEEHKKIVLETDRINELFCTAAADCIVSVNKLLDGARNFIKLQRAHLERENELIYPLMDKLFSEKEWKEIEIHVKIQADPLFNKPSKVEYDHLYKYILELEDKNEFL